MRVLWALMTLGLAACGGEEATGPNRKGYTEQGATDSLDAAVPRDVCNDKGGKQITVRGIAPMGLTQDHLGQPLDKNFRPIPGEIGKSLFPGGEHRTTPVNSMEAVFDTVDTQRQFHASVSVGVTLSISGESLGAGADSGSVPVGITVGANYTKDSLDRYATYRTSQVREVRELNDATYMRPPPAGAVWYLSRIFYGKQYEIYMKGTSRTMSAGVKAGVNVAGVGVQVPIDKVKQNGGIEVGVRGRGLTPLTPQPVILTDPDQVQNFYQADPAFAGVPIYVEYRSIPSVCVPPDEDIPWLAPQRIRFSIDSIDVSAPLGNWTLDARCTLNNEPLDFTGRRFWNGLQVSSPRTYTVYEGAWQTGGVETDVLKCGIEGGAGHSAVPWNGFSYNIKKDNGIVKSTFDSAQGGVNYRVHYTLEFTRL